MILDEILAVKAREVVAARASRSLAQMERAAVAAPPPRDFAAALAAGGPPGAMAVIAEVKKASPSQGVIRPDFDPVAIARGYADGGAAALSVLTDAAFFQGSLANLQAVRSVVALPVLRKDFIIDPIQVYEARAAGADAILLIVAAFVGTAAGGRNPSDLARLAKLAAELGMSALVEVHTAAELQVALTVGATVIGINNRDLRTFTTDLAVTEQLARQVPPGYLLVSESGIRTRADLVRLAQAGARAALVGETLMRQPDPGQALRQLLGVAGS